MRPIDQLDETNWSTRRDQLIYQKRSINKPDKTNGTPFWFKYPFKLHTNRQRWRMNSKCCNSKVLILYFFTWWNITRLYIYKSWHTKFTNWDDRLWDTNPFTYQSIVYYILSFYNLSYLFSTWLRLFLPPSFQLPELFRYSAILMKTNDVWKCVVLNFNLILILIVIGTLCFVRTD